VKNSAESLSHDARSGAVMRAAIRSSDVCEAALFVLPHCCYVADLSVRYPRGPGPRIFFADRPGSPDGCVGVKTRYACWGFGSGPRRCRGPARRRRRASSRSLRWERVAVLGATRGAASTTQRHRQGRRYLGREPEKKGGSSAPGAVSSADLQGLAGRDRHGGNGDDYGRPWMR
jgi:hypothetical protein